MNKNINAIIKPIKIKGDILNYRMYMNYWGTDYCFLFETEEQAEKAKQFQRRTSNIKGATYTNTYGIIEKKSNIDTILGYVTGLNNIKESIIDIAKTCKNEKIQSNFSVYLNNKEYNIITKNIENKNNLYDVDYEELYKLNLIIDELANNKDLFDQKTDENDKSLIIIHH